MEPGFHIENFGCRAARADGEAIAERLAAVGLAAQAVREAGVVVVNTCSVTAEADREARAYIRRAHRLNPEAKIVVTGCYAQRAPEELAAIEGVSAVVGNSHKALAPEIVLELAARAHVIPPLRQEKSARMGHEASELIPATSLMNNGAAIWADDRFAHSFLEEAQVAPGTQTRPNLKIQEGCGNRCTFCVIPQTRGNSRSLSQAAILRQVRSFVVAGGKELVFSGINLGRWGRDFDAKQSLAALVRIILNETDLPRLRLSSIEPMDWTDELIGLFREFTPSRLARHAHLPLQSGSDAVLRRMHRRYRPWHYVEKIAALTAACGDELTLGADVMVGFPGETGAEFAETYELIRALPFGYLHLFPFSPRPGTRAWALHQQSPVPPRVVDERMKALRELAAAKTRAHRSRMTGRTLDAITLHTPPALEAAGKTAALTANFLPVVLDARLPANELVEVRVSGLTDGLELACTLACAPRA